MAIMSAMPSSQSSRMCPSAGIRLKASVNLTPRARTSSTVSSGATRAQHVSATTCSLVQDALTQALLLQFSPTTSFCRRLPIPNLLAGRDCELRNSQVMIDETQPEISKDQQPSIVSCSINKPRVGRDELRRRFVDFCN